MSEATKTMTFAAVALLAVIAALVTRPASSEVDMQSFVGQVLTGKFTNLDDARRLRIVRFDKDTGQVREFEVAEEDGLWVIPSKDGYPADAQRQMAEAATSLMDRKILEVASSDASDHQEYGVIDPLSPKLDSGQEGVGTRVTLSDVHNDPLVDLIVGHEVKDSTNQRYVREAGRDVVYVIDFDPSKLSTNFSDWIEKDLMKINPWDLAEVEIKDYSADLQPVLTSEGRLAGRVMWEPRSDLTLSYDDKQAKWSPVRLRRYDTNANDYVDFQLTDDEELNAKKLNDLKTALDDLRIVDVVRKPAGLSEDLKAGADFLNNADAKDDLQSRGFVAVATSPGAEEEIISSDGELIATMNDGAEYVLRFGRLTSASNGPKPDAASPAADAGPARSDVNRYLFVMARMNEDAVAKPQREPLPELPKEEAATPADASTTDAAAETGAATNDAGAEDTSSPAAADAQTTTDDSTADAAAKPATESAAESDAASAESEPEAASEEAADETDTTTDDTASAESNGQSEEVAKILAERKRIETDNQRKLDDYQNKLKQGREQVKELNARFGDWYFVVSNDVFNKLRLGRDDVIEKKPGEPASTGGSNGEPASAGGTSDDTSDAGAPGEPVPGLPAIPGAGS